MEAFVSLQLDQFVVYDMERAFTLDGLKNSHPIKVPVNHPDEINEIFDSISYNKVCSREVWCQVSSFGAV